MSVSEEEVEEESGCGHEMAVSCEHAIYAPKPTYDQLDQYSSPSKKQDEKQRRTGLGTTITPLVGVSSESEGDEEAPLTRRVALIPPPMARRNRPPLTRQPRSLSDAEVAPLSPPPSLDKEEDEEELVEEEEPELPSTPESGPSNTSAPELYTTTARVMISNIKEEEEDADNRFHLPQLTISPITTTTTTIITTPTTPTNTLNPAILPTTTTSKIPEVKEEVKEGRAWPGTIVFPSLQDAQLRAFGVSVFDKPTNENLSAQEIENKFKQLSLAFKTDSLTLRQRLEVQQRQRDIAETNFERELNHLKTSLLALHENCIDLDIDDAVIQVRKHLDIVTLSSSSLLSASEVWGAVQQEWRVSRALEVLLLHVENVKRLYEHDHHELEEMRKILNEHDIELPVSPGAAGSGQSSSADSTITSRRIRALSLAGIGKQQSHEVGNRRISLVPGPSKTVLKDFLGGRTSRRRASLMPDLRPFHQELTASIAANLSKDKMEEKRHSTNGMLKSSITEEGSESGDEGTTNTQAGAASESSPTATSLTNLTHFPLDMYASSLQDSDQRSDEEVGTSPIHTPTAESHVSNNPATSVAPQSQHWLMLAVEDVLGWARGGQWPFSLQQTYQGARYAFTSLLLLLAAFFLLLTISSGNDGIRQPCHPGWTTIEHVLHPFVTICPTGSTPPT